MNEQELRLKLEKHVEENGVQLNPDTDVTNKIVGLLLHNSEIKGETYCPCRVTVGDPKKDKLIICPCVYSMGEIELQGRCHCNLFWKKQDTV